MTPSISVLMATFNNASSLRDAIESILNQTYSDFEFIIVDDGSIDSTDEILQAYKKMDNRITLIKNEVNRGLAASLNNGLEIAKAKWIARMDGDDLSHPQRFEKQIGFLENNPVDYLGTGVLYQYKNTGKIRKTFVEPLTHGSIAWKLLYACPFIHATTIGLKELILKAGGYNADLRRYEDVDLWRRLVFLGKCANLPDILYTYRIPESYNYSKYTYSLMQKVHQHYLTDLLGYGVSNELGSYLFSNNIPDEKLNDPGFTFEVISVLLDTFSILHNKGWIEKDDLPYIESEFWQRTRYLAAHSQEITQELSSFYFLKLESSERDYLYWSQKKWPRVLRGLGLFLNSPKTAWARLMKRW